MRKTILALIGLIAVLSCTSNSDGNENLPDVLSINGESVGIQGKSFTYFYDNYFELRVTDMANSSRYIVLLFDKYGHFISAEMSVNGNYYAANYPYFSSNYFDFEMSQANIAEGRCVIDFSGKIYENRYDMNSAFNTISGHFTLQSPLPEPGSDWAQHKGLYAKLDGKNWFSPAKSSHEYDSGFWNSYNESDNEYRLVFNASGENTPNGSYNFTANTAHNCIRVEKFNTQTLSYEPWNTQGSMDITAKYQPFQGEYYIDGTFSLTATNPSDTSEVVHFSNGVFKALGL